MDFPSTLQRCATQPVPPAAAGSAPHGVDGHGPSAECVRHAPGAELVTKPTAVEDRFISGDRSDQPRESDGLTGQNQPVFIRRPCVTEILRHLQKKIPTKRRIQIYAEPRCEDGGIGVGSGSTNWRSESPQVLWLACPPFPLSVSILKGSSSQYNYASATAIVTDELGNVVSDSFQQGGS